ncbi:MAG: ABC transporter substrate-binding protein [Propionibacteriaceae bacterium]|jgi:peptide/nickel transport system substrate-binding protein|nr:ABC transporter substrate-binding protein [Propionibacteriaceae bacterium]
MKRITNISLAVALALTASLAACTANNNDSNKATGPATGAAYVTDGTWTAAQVSDPGALDPQLSIVAGLFELSGYAYDNLVGLDPSGDILPQLAKSWTVAAAQATFEINDGVTCSDGSALTAQTIADNLNWISNPENASPYYGSFLPAGITASASGTTLTLDLAQPAPFLLASIANVPIVCDAALKDRSLLDNATLGSGPYVLKEAVPEDHYTYERRDGYTWGPGGATTAESGLPKTIVVRIVQNESTAVNLLLSGEVNLVTTVGADAARAEAAGLASVDVPAVLGMTWYNHADGHTTADPAVRKALTQALNFDDLATAITSGEGSRASMLAVIPPTTCNYDATTGNIAAFDTAAAGKTLETAGYAKGADGKYAKNGTPLTVTFLYDSSMGTPMQAAVELALQQWAAAGITVQPSGLDSARVSEVLFSTGAWDVSWTPINVNSPDQVVSYLSGPTLADGGANFSAITNGGYDQAVADAQTKTGADACGAFKTAEASLYKDSDFLAWAVRPNKIFYTDSEYAYIGKTQVTALRLTAK